MKKNKIILFCLLVLGITVFTSNQVNAHPGRLDSKGGHTCRSNCGKWNLEQGEYHYHEIDGSYTNSKNEKYNSEGVLIEKKDITDAIIFNPEGNWQKTQLGWEYFSDNQALKNVWAWLPITNNGIKTGEFSYKYFDSRGINIDQFFNESGKVFLSLAGPEEGYHKGWWTDVTNNQSYYFRLNTGSRVSGRQFIDGKWRFFRNTGTQAFGFQFINNYWNYFDEKDRGAQVINGWSWVRLSNGTNEWKYFNQNGANIDQFYNENGNIWLTIKGPDRSYYKGWWTDPDNGQKYYFRQTSGSRVSGRQYIDKNWYYFRPTGTVATGWQYIDKSWQYFNLDGTQVFGNKTIGNKLYSFGKDGKLIGNR